MATAKPTVNVFADNDGRQSSGSGTDISVSGSDFPPGTVVNIEVAGRQGTARVEADGKFDWDFVVRPPLRCRSTVHAVVHGSGGIKVKGRGDVICP